MAERARLIFELARADFNRTLQQFGSLKKLLYGHRLRLALDSKAMLLSSIYAPPASVSRVSL